MAFTPKHSKESFDRLVLAKELYQHAFNHSEMPGDFNKMIAVHNFHNAIEVVIRCIALEHEVRTEKDLNVGFVDLVKGIVKHGAFKTAGVRFPYRQDVSDLNAMRNLVQHGAHAPPQADMERWRVTTSRFLKQVFIDYFNLEFDKISPVDLVANETVRALLVSAQERLAGKEPTLALLAARQAFRLASKSIEETAVPTGFHRDLLMTLNDHALTKELDSIRQSIHRTRQYMALLATGLSPKDYARLRSSWPNANLTEDATIYFYNDQLADPAEAAWSVDFVTEQIVRWQADGFEIEIEEHDQSFVDNLLGELKRWSEDESDLHYEDRED